MVYVTYVLKLARIVATTPNVSFLMLMCATGDKLAALRALKSTVQMSLNFLELLLLRPLCLIWYIRQFFFNPILVI